MPFGILSKERKSVCLLNSMVLCCEKIFFSRRVMDGEPLTLNRRRKNTFYIGNRDGSLLSFVPVIIVVVPLPRPERKSYDN
jgi:hypothetical protein